MARVRRSLTTPQHISYPRNTSTPIIDQERDLAGSSAGSRNISLIARYHRKSQPRKPCGIRASQKKLEAVRTLAESCVRGNLDLSPHACGQWRGAHDRGEEYSSIRIGAAETGDLAANVSSAARAALGKPIGERRENPLC